jgi:DNA-binding PadR family transcriptional regulator
MACRDGTRQPCVGLSTALDKGFLSGYIDGIDRRGIKMRNMDTGYLPDLLRGNTEAVLLFLVNEKGRTYGYQLIKEIGQRSGGFFHFKEGTVYPALRKLENEGLLRGDWQAMPNGKERRNYQITEKGREALKKKMALWESFSNAMSLVFKPAKP